jgi:hypothetical protein
MRIVSQLELCNESGGIPFVDLVSVVPLLAGAWGFLFLEIRLMMTIMIRIIITIIPNGDRLSGCELISLIFVSVILLSTKLCCHYQKMNCNDSVKMNFRCLRKRSIGWRDEKPSFDLVVRSYCRRAYLLSPILPIAGAS